MPYFLPLVKIFKKSYGGLASSAIYGSNIGRIINLVGSVAGTKIVKITRRAYELPIGVNYCSVRVKTLGAEYLLQACGKEATELYEKASHVFEGPMTLVTK
jgi:hypothetical protein